MQLNSETHPKKRINILKYENDELFNYLSDNYDRLCKEITEICKKLDEDKSCEEVVLMAFLVALYHWCILKSKHKAEFSETIALCHYLACCQYEINPDPWIKYLFDPKKDQELLDMIGEGGIH